MDSLNEDILLRYLQRESTEDDLKEIKDWLACSEENTRKLFIMEEAFHSGQLERYSSQDSLSRAQKKLDKRIKTLETTPINHFSYKKIMRYAAVVALFLVSAVGITFILKDTRAVEELMVSVSADGNVREIVLPDGTKVWLNKSTQLKYPKEFSETNRQVFLEGEAYFEVTKNKQKPFLVQSDALEVKVLGTSFNMRSKKEDKFAEVVLIEGEVEVRGNNNEGLIVISPGQKAELNKPTQRLTVKEVNAKLNAVWRNNLVPFEKATILEIANTLEYLYNVKVILSPDMTISNTYSGTLIKRNSIDSVLSSLTNSIPISYKITDNTVYIKPAN